MSHMSRWIHIPCTHTSSNTRLLTEAAAAAAGSEPAFHVLRILASRRLRRRRRVQLRGHLLKISAEAGEEGRQAKYDDGGERTQSTYVDGRGE